MSEEKGSSNEDLLEYKKMVAGIAKSVMQRINNTCANVTQDDLIGWGFIGLLDAKNDYDPDYPKGATFITYASRRIQWAMWDGLKAWTHNSNHPSIDDLFESYDLVENKVQLETYENSTLYKYVQKLTPRLRRIIIRRYWYGENISKIAKRRGLTKQRIDFLEKRAVHELRLRMAESKGRGKIMHIGKIVVLKTNASQNPAPKATCPICSKELNPEEKIIYINSLGENPRRYHVECAKRLSVDLFNFLENTEEESDVEK